MFVAFGVLSDGVSRPMERCIVRSQADNYLPDDHCLLLTIRCGRACRFVKRRTGSDWAKAEMNLQRCETI